VHFALKSTPSIGRAAKFLHLVRTECALVLSMKNAIKTYPGAICDIAHRWPRRRLIFSRLKITQKG